MHFKNNFYLEKISIPKNYKIVWNKDKLLVLENQNDILPIFYLGSSPLLNTNEKNMKNYKVKKNEFFIENQKEFKRISKLKLSDGKISPVYIGEGKYVFNYDIKHHSILVLSDVFSNK